MGMDAMDRMDRMDAIELDRDEGKHHTLTTREAAAELASETATNSFFFAREVENEPESKVCERITWVYCCCL